MLISLSKLCVEALRKCSTWLSHRACVEVTIASDVRGRLRRVVHHAQADAYNALMHTITDTESKTSLNIPIKLTDADQILHISVTDLSLTPPTSSDKIIQRYTLYEWYNTIRASIQPAEDPTRANPFWRLHSWNGDMNVGIYCQLNVSQIVCQLSSCMRSLSCDVNRSKRSIKVMFSMYFADFVHCEAVIEISFNVWNSKSGSALEIPSWKATIR
jgi:hypothetical protein